MNVASLLFTGFTAVLVAFTPPRAAAQNGEFATNLPPKVTFTEDYADEVRSLTADGFTEYFTRPDKTSGFKVNTKVSAQGINLNALNGDSEFYFIIGAFEVGGILSDDPRYVRGASSIRIPLRAYDEERDRDVLVGAVVIAWTAAAITVTADVAAPETYSVASQNYLFLDEPIDDVVFAYFEFAGNVLERDVYFRGNATTQTKEVGQGDDATELELSTVKLTGENDLVPPVVVITTPAGGAATDAELVLIGGTVSDNVEVAEVLVQVNGGGFSPAIVSAGNWTLANAPLVLGANDIRAKAVDLDGNESTAQSVVNRWIPLVVAVNGSGTVTEGFLGSTLREPGTSVMLKAKANAGFIFSGWTGAVTSTQESISFVVEPGMTVTANFIPLPFGSLDGKYSGLILTPQGTPAGPVQIQLTPEGKFTAKLALGKRKLKVKGAFDATGRFVGTVFRKGYPFTFDLALDVEDGTETISGTVNDGTMEYVLNSDHAIYSATNPSPQAGSYLAQLRVPDEVEPRVPTSVGLVSVKVMSNGKVKLIGQLGDGTAFSTKSVVLKNGRVPVYFRSRNARTVVGGTLRFDVGGVVEEELQGVLVWSKTAKAGAPATEGFVTEIEVRGVRDETAPQR